VYTDQIKFANLSSQDVIPSEEEETQDGCSQGEGESPQDPEGLSVSSPGAIAVEPCSPKSVYCLANKVRLVPFRSYAITYSFFAQVDLTELCDIAFEDIRSKLDKNNIIHELFSPFTAK